jgi:3-hydroxyisobutyrate dehydrogenase-like beta-hydroxyacid dehydrogenase
MAKRKKGTIGIVGMGTMGGAFAANLVAAGWRVVGYDRNKQATAAAKRAGVETVRNAAAVADAAQIILISLPRPEALAATVREIAQAPTGHRVVVEMSTFKIADKEKARKALQKAGHTMLDCPVSGTGAQAKARDLVFYASGDAGAIRRIAPILEDFGRQTYNVGAFGNGSRMKYVANLLVAINNVASAEAMVLGMKSGLPPQTIFDLIRGGAGNSRIFELRAPMMVKGRYDDATMKIGLWQKDMDVIGDFAKTLKVKTPLFTATEAIYKKARKSGLDEQDTAAVCTVLEKMAKYRRRRFA